MDAFDAIESVLLALPAAVGVKAVPNVKLWPGARVRGRVRPVTANPDPESVACEIVRLLPPELLTVSERV